ncbi:MAG: Transmembrane amino acid transporter protein [Microgenomates bacterium OLB23]|nr:MAG: Transmembrane amino acid transporter protein [Microgenomates bacterium OLB23]
MRKPISHSLEAVATLVGTAIGAGVLGLPYAVSQAGFGIGMVLLLMLGWFNIILQMMFAEVTLRTKEQHQIPGYAGIYIGPQVKKLGFVVGILSAYGTILAYVIASGQILQALIGGSTTAWSLIYLALVSFIIFKGLDTIKILEVIMSAFVASIMLLIYTVAYPHVDINNLLYMRVGETSHVYGVLLFALSATIAIPEVRQEIVGQEKKFPRIIYTANIFYHCCICVVYIICARRYRHSNYRSSNYWFRQHNWPLGANFRKCARIFYHNHKLFDCRVGGTTCISI